MKAKKIKGVLVEPGKMSEIIEIDNTLETLQKCVHGYIECISLSKDIVLVCNEEGKLNGSLPNRKLDNDTIFDTFIVLGDTQEGDFSSLDKKQLDIVRYTFDFMYPPMDLDTLTDKEIDKMREVDIRITTF